jgi:hypothetical protein
VLKIDGHELRLQLREGGEMGYMLVDAATRMLKGKDIEI